MHRELTDRLQHDVEIPVGAATLSGNLSLPAGSNAVVLFAHGSGSSRHSPRNIFVARKLQDAGIGTLLFDLLTRSEEEIDMATRSHRFDIALLAQRLVHATRWLDAEGERGELAIGYFGASTGSAAAIVAAACLGNRIGAVVSRGGRPDLASSDTLTRLDAPTLLIVGGNDDVVLELNERAFQLLRCEKRITAIPGASHLFEEAGALEQVASLASEWFSRHLRVGRTRSEPRARHAP